MSEGMTCCPLSSVDDGDGQIECYSRTHPVARKNYQCAECYEPIPKGSKHEADSGLWDGEFSTTRTCLSCAEIRDHFACGNGYLIGRLWEDLEENFFPDMQAGGPCLDGLSPAAKGRMFEARLEWVFAHDEYEPCDRARPPVTP
jgi:hypothetical protein